MEKIENVDICVVTYNRLAYLQNCIWSIIASTKIKYRLMVISDNSTDGTNEWLTDMKNHNKIDVVIINDVNLGSAKSFNKIINMVTSNYFVMTCDDMYFHRGWDVASIEAINNFDDAGIVTFFNFPINSNDTQLKKINNKTYFRQSTGLGSSLINKELFNNVGGFFIPEGIKMGYFARVFCKSAAMTKLKRNKQYITNPYYSEQMDRHNPGSDEKMPPKLSQEYLYSDYNKMRSIEKNKYKNISK